VIGLFEGTSEDPKAKKRRYVITAIALVVIGSVSGTWMYFDVVHVPQRHVAQHFLNALTAGDTQLAYNLWKADPQHYSYKDFLEDWGDKGFYGPVKSYQIESASSPRREGSGIVVTVEVNPYNPFPGDNDVIKSHATKEVRLWVEGKDKSLGFAP
jgi:hypothetical protein